MNASSAGPPPPPAPASWDAAAGDILAELTTALITADTIADIAHHVLRSAVQLTGSACGLVGHIQPDTGRLVAPAITVGASDACRMPDQRTDLKTFAGLWQQALASRQPLMTNAPGTDPRSEGMPPGHLAIQQFLCVPALAAGQLLGVIGLANPGRDYTPRDLLAVERLAALYALASQRLWAEKSLRASHERLEAAVAERTAQLQQANEELRRDIAARLRAESELLDSQRKLELVAEHMLDLVSQLDTQGIIQYASPSYRTVLGYQPESLIGTSGFSLVHPDDAAHLVSDIATAMQSRSSGRLQARVRRQDGSYIRVESIVSLVTGANGAIQGIVFGSRDITDRHLAEEAERGQRALAESLRDTAALLTSTLDLDEVLERVLDNAGRVVPHDAANIMLVDAATGVARVARCVGYAALGLQNTVRELRFPISQVPLYARMMRTGEPAMCADNQADPDWVNLLDRNWLRSWLAAPVRIKSRTVGFVNLDSAIPGYFTDEHARRLQAFAAQAAIAIENAQLYQQLSISEQAYRALVELSPDAIVLTDLDGTIALCNRQAAVMHGYPRADDLVGMSLFDLVAPEDRPHIQADAASLLAGTKLRDQEYQLLRRDGTRGYASISATLQPGPDGDARGFVGVIRDVEERKQAEERLLYISTHDALTGLYNRAYFEAEMARLEPGRRFPVSVAVADVNGLKAVNDTLGHAAGDDLLRQVALLLRSAFRAEDMIARIGGDEFCVILPDAPVPVAQLTVRRLRAVLASHNARPGVTAVSISIGAATAQQRERLIDAFRLADSRMYQDKSAAKGDSSRAVFLH
jgi:diguanylate cyclase (GGDEF)-like protein/PAS domain S-box-containing protein